MQYSYEGPITFHEGVDYEGDDQIELGPAGDLGHRGDDLAAELARAFDLKDAYAVHRYGRAQPGRCTANVRITVTELPEPE